MPAKKKTTKKPAKKPTPKPGRRNQKGGNKRQAVGTENPLTYNEAAIRSGLIYPMAPYRQLGEAYLTALKDKLTSDLEFRFTSLAPQPSPAEWQKWLSCSDASLDGLPIAITSPLGRWLLHLQEVEGHEMIGEKLAALVEQETWLRGYGSSLEELIVFDQLREVLGKKYYLDQWAEAVDSHHDIHQDIRPKLVQSLRSHFSRIERTVKRITNQLDQEKTRQLASRFCEARELLMKSVALGNQAKQLLCPILPTLEKERKRALKEKLSSMLPGPPSSLRYKQNLFQCVIDVAVQVMLLRGIKPSDAYLTLGIVFPPLFPSILFPNQPCPIPKEATAIRQAYYRLNK